MRFTKVEDIIRWRRHIHQNPELSKEEFKTTEYIREELRSMGLDYEEVDGMPTATIAYIGTGMDSAKTILLRADIDALPIKEENDIDFKSCNPGVMHACGHDAHAAMLLGATREILGLRSEGKLKNNVLVVFQPSEESTGGANVLIDSYPFEKYSIDASFALHINPDFEEGVIATRPGPIMASCNEFTVKIVGKSAHVGIRENGINAINAAIQVYQQFQTIPTYDLNSKHTNIIHIGKMNVGEVMNSVPTNGYMEGTIRTYDMDDLEISKNRMQEICQGVELSTRASINLHFEDGYPALLNDKDLIDFVASTIEKSGARSYIMPDPYLLGEDFSFFKNVSPISYSFVGIRNEDLGYTSGLHTPWLQMREEALVYGVDYLVEIAKTY